MQYGPIYCDICTTCWYQTTATGWERVLKIELELENISHTLFALALYCAEPQICACGKYHWPVTLIRNLSVTFSGAPNCDVAYSLDSAYLGPFTFLGLTAMLKKTPKPASHNGAKYLLFEKVY